MDIVYFYADYLFAVSLDLVLTRARTNDSNFVGRVKTSSCNTSSVPRVVLPSTQAYLTIWMVALERIGIKICKQ